MRHADRRRPARTGWTKWIPHPMLLWFGLIGAFALYSTLFPYHLPFGASNGTYVNPCCEKIVLADGKLMVGRELAAEYVIDRGKGDPYIAPDALVMMGKDGIQVHQLSNPLFITFVWKGKPRGMTGNPRTPWIGEDTRPSGIELTDGDGKAYLFTREGAQ